VSNEESFFKKMIIKLIISFILIFFLPSFVFVAFNVSSLSIGIVLSSILLLLINYKIVLNIHFNTNIILLSFFIIIILLLFSDFYLLDKNISKPFYSLIIIFMVMSSCVFSKYLLKIKIEKIEKNLFIFIFIVIFFGYLKLIYIPHCCNYNLHEKATFPFSEESHFSLVFGMLSIIYTFIGKPKQISFILINSMILSVSFPSLTLLIFSFLIFFVVFLRLKPFIFSLVFFTVLPITLALGYFLMINIDYFSSRIDFSSTNNLTSLVFLQGWELAYLNIIDTYGIGLGFQMLGSEMTKTGVFTNLIIHITGSATALNISDGGLFAAKIIAEFGIIGIIGCVFFIFWIIKIIFNTNKIYNFESLNEIDKRKLFMFGIIFSYIVEMFFRGYGYFSPGVFMLLTAIFSLYNIPKYSLFIKNNLKSKEIKK